MIAIVIDITVKPVISGLGGQVSSPVAVPTATGEVVTTTLLTNPTKKTI